MTRSPIRAVLTASVLAGTLVLSSVSAAMAEDPVDIIVVDEEQVADEDNGTIDRGETINLRKVFASRGANSIAAARALAPFSYPGYFKTARYARWYAKRHIEHTYGWGQKQMSCLTVLWQGESSWRMKASGARGKYLGIPQLSRSIVKASNVTIEQYMKSVEIQIHLGAKYIKHREGYGGPCKALSHANKRGWY